MSRVLQSFAKVVAEQASLNGKKRTLDAVLSKRKADYDRSMPKHAEFPSVPELEKKFRERDLKQRNELNVELEENALRMKGICESFVSQLLISLPNLKEAIQRQAPAPALQELDPKLEEWKTSVEKAFQEKLEKQAATFTKEHSSLGLDVRKELKANFESALAAQERKHADEMEALRGRMEEKLGRDIQAATERAEIQISSQSREIEKLKQSLSSHTDSTLAAWNQQFAALEDASNRVRADCEAITGKWQELSSQLVQHDERSSKLRADLQSVEEILKTQTQAIENYDRKLEGYDADSLNDLAELSMEWPNLKNEVSSLGSQAGTLHNMKQDVHKLERVVASLLAKAEATDKPSPGFLSDWMPDIDKRISERIQATNKRFAEECGKLIDRTTQERIAQQQAYQAELAALKSQSRSAEPCPSLPDPLLEKNKLTVEKLEQDVEKLSNDVATFVRQLNETNQLVQDAKHTISDKHGALSYQITTLDNQFNNLTTNTLAESILGYLEQVYPSPRQLIENDLVLDKLVKEISARVGHLEAAQAQLQGPAVARTGDAAPQPNSKKRKLDS